MYSVVNDMTIMRDRVAAINGISSVTQPDWRP